MYTFSSRPNWLHAKDSALPRLRGKPLYPEGFVVVCLRYGSIGLMTARRADAFVLEIDPGRCPEELLEEMRPVKRGRSPDQVFIQDLVRNVDPPFCAHFLLDEVHREYGCQHIRCYGLTRCGVQRRRNGFGQVGLDIVPLPGYIFFVENNFSFHGYPLCFFLFLNR